MINNAAPPPDHKAVARRRMVEEQIKARGIVDDKLLAAMVKVPRHMFVEKGLDSQAYSDRALPIGEGQTISQPYMVAIMTASLRLTGHEKVLEIGTGSGYQTAVLAELAAKVFTIERLNGLTVRAKGLLDQLGYKNVILRVGDGTLGWKQFAPYDRILVTAGAPRVPVPLEGQLAEGGILVVPVGNSVSQKLAIATKKRGKIKVDTCCPCTFVPLVGKEGWNNS
jgi:protein-L-isoaspartate(D-aspartate) O-methyltransferase